MKLNLKCVLIAAMAFLLLQGNGMKLYAQGEYLLILSPSGSVCLPQDFSNALGLFCEMYDPICDEMESQDLFDLPFHVIINSCEFIGGFYPLAFCTHKISSESLTGIGEGAFIAVPFSMSKCGGMVNSLKEVDFPYVTDIGATAFSGCAALTTVNIPLATSLGGNAFYNCKALPSINMQRVKSIGMYAFQGCNALKKVNFNSVTDIKEGAFWQCAALETVEEMLYVESMGKSAFQGCSSLKSITANAKTIGGSTFKGCTSLEEVLLQDVEHVAKDDFEGCYKLKIVDLNRVEYFPGLISQEEGIFENRKELERVFLRNCKAITPRSFKGCSSLDFVVLPNCVLISNYAFQDNTSLETILCPNVTHIGEGAFAGCTALTEARMPKVGGNTIEEGAFRGCTALTKVEIGTGHLVPTPVNVAAGAFDVPSNIELILGENVLPKPEGTGWNGNTWKKVTVVPAETGIEEVTAPNALIVYPNPVTDRLHIEWKDANDNRSTEYVIYNLQGQPVMKGRLPSFGGVGGGSGVGGGCSLNVESLPSGTYYLSVGDRTAKFVKR